MTYSPPGLARPATITDKPSTLNMQGFWGNDLIVRLNLLGDAPVPVVTCIASYSGGRAYPVDMQPGVDTSGRTATIRFVNTKRYQYTGSVDIAFDGRVVLSGSLQFSRETVSSQTPGMNVNVTLSGGSVVNVTVLVGASAGGSESGQSALIAGEAIPIGRLVANVDGKAVLYNPAVPAHAYALIGINTQSTPQGSVCSIQTKGTINIPGWGLTAGQAYRAGLSGNLSTAKVPGGFSQLVGRAISADSFLFNPQPIIY